MPSSHFALVPLAVLLGASLQGCAFNHLPPSVQIAIGHACIEKAEAVTEKEALKNVGKADGCDELDKDRMETLGLTDCAKVFKRAISLATEVECEAMVGAMVSDACETVDADCKKAVDSEVEAWKVSEIKKEDSDKEKQDEQKDGFEAVLALIDACHKGIHEKIDKLGDDGPGAKACADAATDNLTIMGITEDHCREYRKKQAIDMHTIVCTAWCLSQDDELGPEDITNEYLQKTVSAYFELTKNNDGAQAADRLRLFESAIKSKKWPQRLHPWSTNIAKFGGAAVAALAALVIVGMRRRTQHVEAQDDELLTNIE